MYCADEYNSVLSDHRGNGGIRIYNLFHEPVRCHVITCIVDFMLASVAHAIGIQYIWNLSTRSMVLMCTLS